jgi:transposase
LRCDLLPESWKADRETQARRQQVRLRATLVRQRTRLKNQMHAVLHQQGLRSPVTDLFGKRGRQWLAGVKLPAQARESVNVCLRLLDGYSEEIQKQHLQLSEKAKHDPRVARARKLLIAVHALLHDGAVFDEDKFAAV